MSKLPVNFFLLLYCAVSFADADVVRDSIKKKGLENNRDMIDICPDNIAIDGSVCRDGDLHPVAPERNYPDIFRYFDVDKFTPKSQRDIPEEPSPTSQPGIKKAK